MYLNHFCNIDLSDEVSYFTKTFIMKDYMMIFLGAPYDELGLSPDEIQERMGKWFAWTTKMKEGGYLKGGEALHTPAKRISGKERVVTDGPFVESKELIGGYYVVSAENIDAVIEIAQDFPDYDLEGSVEIREVVDFNQ